MPKVGNKHYPYTSKGKAQAKADANKKGVSVGYKKGGATKKKPKKGACMTLVIGVGGSPKKRSKRKKK